jgi:hypothetical protein
MVVNYHKNKIDFFLEKNFNNKYDEHEDYQ